jgi:hypothetical protein
VSVSQARSAYAALLLIPGFDQLRFNPLLCRCKKLWNVSEAKYSHFWSVEILVQKLAREKLDWANVEAVRNRLILCWRLFALHRSVDLARLYRKISFGGGGGLDPPPFVLIQRKGWKKPRWEQIVVLENPELSPWHLLRHYVAQTSSLPEGSLVLRSLKPPFAPLSSDRIASITKNLLKKFGVPTAV